MKDSIYVAKLGKTVGLQGHLKLFIDSDFPKQFKKGRTFFTNKKIKLTVLEFNKDRNLIKFENYLDLDSAKKLTNIELFSSIEDTIENCELKKNEFFWFDLISCEIFEDGLKLGVVKDVHRFPISDYLEITTSIELLEKGLPKTFLIPHIFDKFILNVDIKNKKIEVADSFSILENS